jgi:hypothetical protein
MIVRLNCNQLRYFRRKALHSNKEIYAILFGRVFTPTVLDILRFGYPTMLVSTPKECQPDGASCQRLVDAAAADGLVELGTIHTHPMDEAAPWMSPTDLRSHRCMNHKISGICTQSNGKTFVAFWEDHKPLPVEWEYLK